MRIIRVRKNVFCIAAISGLTLAGCDKHTDLTPEIRPVRTVIIRHGANAEATSLTGSVQAQDTVNLAFRVGGRLVDRKFDIGDQVKPGQVIGHLEQQDAQASLQTAQASLLSANSVLALAQVNFQRQKNLLAQDATSRASYDQANQQLQAARAGLQSAQAQVKSARDNQGYTVLQSDIAGSITAKGAEPGEVVQAGQMIVQVAQQGGRDAVFNVPGELIRRTSKDIPVTVELSDAPNIKAQGRVRLLSPVADAATGTYVVKVSLIDPPPTMRLGATVKGMVSLNGGQAVEVPSSALTEIDGKPAVWVVSPKTMMVSIRHIGIVRFDPDVAVLSGGLKDGDIVVTAGVQALQPGEKVRLLDAASNAQ